MKIKKVEKSKKVGDWGGVVETIHLELTEQEKRELKEMEKFWCSCGNPSGETEYWGDGENPNCSKHCYTCKDCGKLTQTG